MGILMSCATEHSDVRNYEISLKSNSPLEEFVESVRAIHLETNPDCLISEIDRIISDEEHLYVLDRRQAVIYVFDKDGRYVSKVERKGRSGNEYVTIADIEVFDGDIYVLDDVSQKMVRYDIYGTALQIIRLNDWYNHFAVEESRILLYSERSNRQMYDIVVIDHDGEVISQYLPFERDEGFAFRISPFHRNTDGRYFLTFPYDGRIFSLSEDECRCEMSVTAPGYEFPSPKELEKLSYEEIRDNTLTEPALRRITHVSSRSGLLFMMITAFHDGAGLRDSMILLDLESGECKSYLTDEERSDAYPYFTNIVSVADNKLYSSVDRLLMEQIDNIIGKEADDTDCDMLSNPVIFIYDLRYDMRNR